jgi:TolA-binding protein
MRNGFYVLGFCLLAVTAWGQDADALKAKAYQLYQSRQFSAAAQQFEAYLQERPTDSAAMLDYGSLLAELNRHEQAARVLETLRRQAPRNETVTFKLAVEYANLKRFADAERLFSELAKSRNPAMASAAADALARARSDEEREEKFKAEQNVYDLANGFKYEEVVRAVDELKTRWPLSYGMQMQRLYALQSMKQYALSLSGAEQLAAQYSSEPDLILLRASLLAQLGRMAESDALYRRVKKDYQGTPAAAQATQKLAVAPGKTNAPPRAAIVAAKPENAEEAHVYELARQRQHRELIAAVDAMEKKGAISLNMQMQRLYSYQALGESKQAIQQLNQIASGHSNSTELAFVKSDLLVQERRYTEASALLKKLKDEQPQTPVAVEAQRRLDALPPITNLDKRYWGEAYASGDYLGRFGTVVGSGFVRQGAFVPNARWLQPYAELRFGADTRSGTTGDRTIVTDNHLGLYAGVRAQPFVSEYLFAYAQGGGDVDFLDRRHNGDFSYDYQVGIYGFKSWGPGTVLLRTPPGWVPPGDRPDSFAPETRWADRRWEDLYFFRGDWFLDVGADFSYYHRYASWIGYGQAHEGFRLFQFGPRLAFDAYVVENVSWDVEGNYFDNLFEIGPGARFLWVPQKGWEIILRGEWLNGFYFGRGRDAFVTAPESHYDEIHVALSVGLRW